MRVFDKNFLLNFILATALALSLNACKSKNDMEFDKDQMISADSSFNKQKFMEQSKVRSEEESKYGPKIETTQPITDAERYRRLVNKEENFDYIDISTLDKNNFKISVNVENMNIRDFAAMVSNITGVNILVSDEVYGTVTAKLKDVLWSSMLDSILDTKKLAKHVDTKSNIIRIHDQTTVVQLEDFDRKRKENVQKSLLLKKSSQPLYTEIFKLFYTKPDQVKTQIDSIFGKAASSEGLRNINPEVTIDTRKNLLIVKARKEDMEVIAKLITELDTRTQQIFIEAFIVEVEDGFEQAFGTNFAVQHVADGRDFDDLLTTGETSVIDSTVTVGSSSLAAVGATSGIGILTGITDTTQLQFQLTATEAQGLSKVISNPRIFTLDNQESIIFQGDEVPYETVSQDGTQIQFKEAGLKLTVTPQIIGDGNLQLSIQVNKDTVDTSLQNPPITKSEIKTNLVTKDGEIVVMGGIYTETDTKTKDKVPGLGDIPGVGNLFRRKSDEKTKKELIIFIIPKVI